MMILLTIIHVLVCVFLVIVVLLQSGKAADLAGAFGGMGSQTAFGPRGAATVLSKATTIAAGLFMVTSLSLAILATKNAGTGSSVLERQTNRVTKSRTAPATTAPAPGVPAGSAADTWRTCGGDARHPPLVSRPLRWIMATETSKTVPLDVNKLPKVDPNSRPPSPARQRRNRICSSHGFAEVAELADALA